MTQRIRERLSNDGIDNAIDCHRESVKRGEFIDMFTTVEPEDYRITLARLPKCMQPGYKPKDKGNETNKL